MIECLSRLRPETDDLVGRRAAVAGVDEDLEPEDGRLLHDAIRDWLAVQKVARGRPVDGASRFVDVNDVKTQDALSTDPRVGEQLDAMYRDGYLSQPFLDGAALRVAGRKGRRLTQAVSRAVYDAQPRPDGIRYRSRLDDAEGCWAVFGHVDIDFESAVVLSPNDTDHCTAVREVLQTWRLPIPDLWRE